MTCRTRPLWFIGSTGVLMALIVGKIPDTLAGAADPTIPPGESEPHQSLPPEKKRSLALGMATDQPGEVESRGMPQLQRPMMPGNPAQPSAPGQPTAQATRNRSVVPEVHWWLPAALGGTSTRTTHM